MQSFDVLIMEWRIFCSICAAGFLSHFLLDPVDPEAGDVLVVRQQTGSGGVKSD